ncbi:hypothetical protein CAEBREN_32430 [Caenorhabditis brenneri]|uniref:USP domain-containing protein n=1 Tax=Caenorhabditis brenneri TaxID=135651 RepID=G0NXY5_CAEBE|nr:hypothetical protein CAEBREN_32430 [Caenorhabditis brenneri]
MQAISSCPSIVSRCTQLRRLYPKKLLPSFAQNFDGTSVNLSEAHKVVEGVIWLISILLNKSEENVVLSDDKAEMLLKNVRRRMGKIARRFDNDEQHDAHDYLMQVFRCFDEVMTGDVEKDRQRKRAGILGNSSLHLNPNIAVRFKTEQSLYCPTCKKENFNTSIHEMLQVPLRYEKSTTLCDLLKTSFQGHTLERKCPQCECPVAYARDRIITFPQCLIMNLQRYRNIYQKNNSKVKVPMKLETSRFSSFSLISFDFNGNFMELNTRDELACKSDDIRRLGVKNITGGINNESGTPKLLGGAGDAESGSDDDCEILAEKVKFSFNFKLITHRKSVLEMVGKMDITANEESIKQHLKTLQRSPAMELDKKDEPGTTIKIETDGNCFFRAISWCLTGTQKYHKKVRKATVNYMKNSKQLLENSCNGDYEIHVRNMEYDQEWATECEIAAIANLLKVNIYTYLPTGWNCQTPKECVPTNIGSIYLNNQEEHYEPVVSLKKSPEQPKELKSHKRKPLDDDDDQDSEDIKKGRKVDGDPSEEKKPDESSSRKNPRRSCNEKTKQNSNSIQYNLVAVVCHEGQSLDNGHYYAYIKDMFSESWHFSSDKTFRPASEEDVIDEVAPKAYLLFYDRQ